MIIEDELVPRAKFTGWTPFPLYGIACLSNHPTNEVICRKAQGLSLNGFQSNDGTSACKKESFLTGGIACSVHLSGKWDAEEVSHLPGPFRCLNPGLCRHARIRALHPADVRGGISSVDGIKKNHAGFAGPPGGFRQPVE